MKRFTFLLCSALLLIKSNLFFGQKISVGTGNWSSAATWSPSGVPTAADNVTISTGNVVSIDVNGNCNSLTVNGSLHFSGSARALTIGSDLLVNSTGLFNVTNSTTNNNTNTVTISGNITNNGILNFVGPGNRFCNALFTGIGDRAVSGSGATTNFDIMTITLGSTSNILEILSTNFSAKPNFLVLNSGTFKISSVNATTLVPFTSAAAISPSTGLWLNSNAAVVTTSAGVALSGSLTVSNGTINIGDAVNEDLISTGGSLSVLGGVINVAGKYYNPGVNDLVFYNQSGGSFVVPAFGSTNTTIAPFQITSSGSVFNMTGGAIIIPREGGTGAQDLGYTNTVPTATVTGGILQIGSASTPTGQTISINSSNLVPGLLLNSVNATAKLSINSLNVLDDITVNSGTLQSNNLNITLGGDWSNNGGLFVPGSALVTFSSTGSQSIFKSGGEIFNDLYFVGAGVKTFSSPVTASGNFSIASGSAIDVSVSNYSLSVAGNFINDGSFNAESGLVVLNGTSAQNAGGTAVTTFWDLSLNNAAGAVLTNSANLKGTLTLSSGTFNANGMLTMVSTATASARVAEITGSGDITGNVTVQRFAPGGSTGWALMGTPISSPLTFADWNDDFAITCSLCPNGYFVGGSAFTSIYSYDETQPGPVDTAISYVPINNIGDTILLDKGYWVYLGDGQFNTNPITIDVTGALRKFDNIIPLDYTNYGSASDDGWNLIHNPYPSPISWSGLRGATANIDDAIYVYNADLSGGSGSYASYVNGISSPALDSGGIADVIPMSQGFYVHSTGATSLTAKEADKVAGNPTFLRTNNAQSGPLLRIRLSNATYHDESVLYIQAGATSGFESHFDSYKIRGQEPNAPIIAIVGGAEELQINGISPISGNFTIPLKTLTGYAGTYTISASNIASFPMGACINLFDKFTQTTTNLNNSYYVFNLADTTSVARFDLKITINPLSINASVNQPNCNVINNGQIIASGANAGPWNYYWKQNGSAVKTSLNKSGADSLSGLTDGNFELEVNTVGMCDNNTSSYLINQKIKPVAGFVCADSLVLNNHGMPFYNSSLKASTYFWDFGDQAGTSSDVSPIYNYNAPGLYRVKLTSTSSTGCVDSAGKLVKITANIVSIVNNKSNLQGLLIKTIGENEYVLQEQFDQPRILDFKLYDMTGKIVKDYGKMNSELIQLNVNLNNFSSGIYFMKIKSSEDLKVVKLPVR